MKVLVVGGSGLLGMEVTGQARRTGYDVVATYHSRRPAVADGQWRRLDIRQRNAPLTLITEVQPDAITNSAYQQSDWVTTAHGAMHVALAAAAAQARLVHVSSDAVFSGTLPRYDETHSPDPTTPYGAAKAAAETAVKGLAPTAVIARTSLIIGHGHSPHERFVHALASGATTGALFTDDVRCPVHVVDLAAALLELASSPYAGVHHVVGADAISRHELGVLIAHRDGLDPDTLPTALRAGSGLPGPIKLRLDCAMTQERLATRLRGAREFLNAADQGADRQGYERLALRGTVPAPDKT